MSKQRVYVTNLRFEDLVLLCRFLDTSGPLARLRRCRRSAFILAGPADQRWVVLEINYTSLFLPSRVNLSPLSFPRYRLFLQPLFIFTRHDFTKGILRFFNVVWTFPQPVLATASAYVSVHQPLRRFAVHPM